jgi:hypothetical protein
MQHAFELRAAGVLQRRRLVSLREDASGGCCQARGELSHRGWPFYTRVCYTV